LRFRRAVPASITLAVLILSLTGTAAGPVPAASATTPLAQQDDTDDPDADDVAEEDEPGLLFGTLREGGDGIEGVELSVTDADGELVGTTVSDDAGRWEFEVEGGEYVVAVEGMPEGIELRDDEGRAREVSVDPGSRTAVPFQFGEAGEISGRMILFAQQILSGLRIGLILAMTAVGLSLIFGTTGLINFAHGELVVFGAIVTWMLNVVGPELHLLIAGTLGVIASGLLGLAIDRGMFRPLRRRGVGLFQLLVVTIGLGLVLRNLLLIWFGGEPRQYADYIGQQRLTLGPFGLTPRVLIVMLASAAILVGVATLLRTSRIGKAMRAVADNRDLAESSGIDVERVVSIVWVSGAALAGLGGIFYGVTLTVEYLSGFQLLLLMFAGVILGGLGTAYGAMLGSLVVGLITELSVVWFPNELKYAWGLGVLVLVLLVRPQGLLGRRERIG
jgi:neutral amino acid transport system permease protein